MGFEKKYLTSIALPSLVLRLMDEEVSRIYGSRGEFVTKALDEYLPRVERVFEERVFGPSSVIKTIALPRGYIERIDRLVDRGVFMNRGEAIRSAIRTFLLKAK